MAGCIARGRNVVCTPLVLPLAEAIIFATPYRADDCVVSFGVALRATPKSVKVFGDGYAIYWDARGNLHKVTEHGGDVIVVPP